MIHPKPICHVHTHAHVYTLARYDGNIYIYIIVLYIVLYRIYTYIDDIIRL